MRVISRKRLKEFYNVHADAEGELEAWFREAKRADWNSLGDIRARYKDADLVGDYVVFNICHNKYRLTVKVRYRKRTIFVYFVDTHAAYSRRKLK